MGGTCRNSSDPAVVRLACSPKLDRDDQAYSEPAMRTVNMQVAKTHLSRLVEAAANGEPFIIARAGKPMVKVVAIDAPTTCLRRTGFLAGQITVPRDFDRMGSDAIRTLFEGGE